MKLFKKVLIGALSAAMLFGSVLSVSAAGELVVPSVIAKTTLPTSETAGVKTYQIQDQKDFFKGHDMKADAARQADVDAIVAANKAGSTEASVKAFQKDLEKSSAAGKDAVIKALEGKKWLTTFFEVIPENANDLTASKEVTLSIASIKGYNKDDVSVVHFNPESQTWEVLEIVKIDGDKVTLKFNGFSPAAIAVVANKTAPVTPTVTPAPAATTANASPKTGVTTNWMGFAVAAVAFAVCAAFSRKKRA